MFLLWVQSAATCWCGDQETSELEFGVKNSHSMLQGEASGIPFFILLEHNILTSLRGAWLRSFLWELLSWEGFFFPSECRNRNTSERWSGSARTCWMSQLAVWHAPGRVRMCSPTVWWMFSPRSLCSCWSVGVFFFFFFFRCQKKLAALYAASSWTLNIFSCFSR